MQHIYLASVNAVPCDFETKLEELNEQRRAKVLRCKNIMDKKRSYLAGRLLSYGTKQEGIEEASVCLAPYDWEKVKKVQANTEGEKRFFGNISHSGEYVAVAISDEPVGVDIEQYRMRYNKTNTKRHMELLAKRIMNEAEYEKYSNISQMKECSEGAELCEDAKDFFLQLWTRKEAYAKWNGKGIALDFSGIDVLCDNFYSRKIGLEASDYLWLSVYPYDCDIKLLFDKGKKLP